MDAEFVRGPLGYGRECSISSLLQAACPAQALVLGYGRGRNKFKLLLPQLGALLDYKSATPLKPGATLALTAARLGGSAGAGG